MRAVFPDNTVLCNFAVVCRLDLLEAVLRGRGRWTEAVAYEAERSSIHLPALASLPAAGWLGEPIVVDAPDEVKLIEGTRRVVFCGSSSAPLQHLGEAQTLHIIRHRTEFADSRWVTDDRDALDFARRQGIDTAETCDLVADAVAMADIDQQAGFDLLQDMSQRGRRIRLPRAAIDLGR
ncbi:MAG: hypothetical protein ACRC0L_02520 [Angustibacter sp.]